MHRRLLAAAFLLTALPAPPSASAQARWQTLPPTPALPQPTESGTLSANGAKIWHASFGADHPGQDPVILLHGGLANSNYWGLLIPALAPSHRVIAMDSRGHGRSTSDSRPFSYDLMADDVIALMDALHIPTAAIVGWSDGAIIGIDLALRHPTRVSRVFAFAGNTDTSGAIGGANPVFTEYVARAAREYAALSPTPTQYSAFERAVSRMWSTQPNWTAAQLRQIHTPILIIDGDHDEAIKRSHTEMMARTIPGARLQILPQTSHFAFLQDPATFNAAVLAFLRP